MGLVSSNWPAFFNIYNNEMVKHKYIYSNEMIITWKNSIHQSVNHLRSRLHQASIRYRNCNTANMYIECVLTVCIITWLLADLPYWKLRFPANWSRPWRLRKGWRYATFAFSVPLSLRKILGHPKIVSNYIEHTCWESCTLALIVTLPKLSTACR